MSEPTTRYVVGDRDAGKRLDQFLHEKIPGLSRTRIQRAIRERLARSLARAVDDYRDLVARDLAGDEGGRR